MRAQSHAEQQAQAIRSFCSLLDPTDLQSGRTVADLYSLRHLCLQSSGIPDTASGSASIGWLRAQAWRVLLGYLGQEKREWPSTLDKRRGEYYQFIIDFFPQTDEDRAPSSSQLPGKVSDRDRLLDQIYRDLSRSRKNAFAFYRQEVGSSHSCPLTPEPVAAAGSEGTAEKRLKQRHAPLRRLKAINSDYSHSLYMERATRRQEHASDKLKEPDEAELQALTTPVDVESKKPFITLQPASPNDVKGVATQENDFTDQRWHSLLRILYIHALLNPSVGYVQGMNEVLFVLLYVMGTSSTLPESGGEEGGTALRFKDDIAGAHAEADAFWCFSSLVAELRDLYDFDNVDHATARLRVSNQRPAGPASTANGGGGMAALLIRFSLRLKWLDEGLWRALHNNSLDPRLPYYSLRWLACLVSTELSLPSIVRVWDALLSESSEPPDTTSDPVAPKLDFLIDVCCSMLISIRGLILPALAMDDEDEAFSAAMDVLQSFPEDDIGPVLEMACLYRQRRLAAPLTGDAPPLDDEEEEHSGTLRNRAISAFREWRSTSNPLGTSSVSSTPQRRTDRADEREVSSSASPAARFKRYAETFQTSDAAASLSKASTNWQAKAMATWNGSRNATPTKEAFSSNANPLNELGTSFLQKLRATSESVSSRSRGAQDGSDQNHPALRWSRESMPPQLPVPDVHDSPPERDVRGHARLGSGFAGFDRPTQQDSTARSTGSSFSSASQEPFEQHTPNSSPAPSNFNRFAHLPSLQHAAAAGIRAGGSPAPKAVGGPKPLLLQTAARPPREHSSNGSVVGDEPMSRKVSSGPMAANVSPRAGNTIRRRGDNASSSAASHRDSAHTVTSLGSSVQRSYESRAEGASPNPSVSGDETWMRRGENENEAIPPMPALTSVEGQENNDSPSGLQRSKATVSALAFGGRKVEEGETTSVNVGFGSVASSADVPLTQQASLKRNVPRRESSTAELARVDPPLPDHTGSQAGSSITEHGDIANRNTISPRPSSLSRPRGPREAASAKQTQGLFEHPRSAPVPPPPPPADDADQSNGLKKYTLSDAPVAPSSVDAALVARRESNSSSRRSSGIHRSRRTLSAAKRELGVRPSSANRSDAAEDRVAEDVEGDGAEGRSGSHESDADESVTGVGEESVIHRRVSRHAHNRLAVVAPGQTLAIESGTSVTPSPGPDEGRVFDAHELMELLRHGGGADDKDGRVATLMARHGVSEEDVRAAMEADQGSKVGAANVNTGLLGPRPQKSAYLQAPSDGVSESGATSEEEFYDAAGIEGQRSPDLSNEGGARTSY